MGREKTPSKRLVRNPLSKMRRHATQQGTQRTTRATMSTMSTLAPQRHDTPHQSPAEYTGYEGYEEYEQQTDDAAHEDEDDELHVATVSGDLTHERARELIVAQTTQLLPPAEANALADHLLICDDCYRFAQDVAAQRRNAHTNQ